MILPWAGRIFSMILNGGGGGGGMARLQYCRRGAGGYSGLWTQYESTVYSCYIKSQYRSVTWKSRAIISGILPSCGEGSHGDCCVQFWDLHFQKDLGELKRVQWRSKTWLEVWETWLRRKGWKNWDCFVWRRKYWVGRGAGFDNGLKIPEGQP